MSEESTRYVPWDVHNEFARRIDEQEHRQDARIKALEENVREISRLAVSVEKMAVSMENMTTEQKRQGERLDEIEKKPAKKWDNLVWEAVKYVIAFALGAILIRLGVTP